MDMTAEGIAAIIANAQAAVNRPAIDHEDGGKHILVPEGFELHKVPALNPKLPDFIAERRVFVEQQSFVDYLKAFASGDEARIFAKPERGAMEAHLDYHIPGEPRPNQFVATFDCKFDENWKRWREIDRKEIGQVEFAYFVEEMMHTIGSPDGMSLLEMAQHLKIHRSMVMKSSKRLSDGTVDFEFSETDETSVKGGHAKVPEEITIVSPIYMMRPAQSVVAKLRTRADKGQPLKFRIDILNRSLIELEAFNKMRLEVADATGMATYLSA